MAAEIDTAAPHPLPEPNGSPPPPGLPLAGASHQAYVSELLSFTLDRLHKEPELLRVDAERIRRQMQEVAVGSYRAFIAADEALSQCAHQLSSMATHLDDMVKVATFVHF